MTVRAFTLLLLILGHRMYVQAQDPLVTLERNNGEARLLVDGNPLMINGMNWDYFPIGTNYTYTLWDQPDAFIEQALADEMTLLRDMGVNAVRIYTGIQPKWIRYIYERYGIYTMLNHSFGRYGLTVDGQWISNTDYGDPRVAAILLEEVTTLAQTYRGTPGLLLYLLGNENNYGLFWEGAETENTPEANRVAAERAGHMYALLNRAAQAVKAQDTRHPVAICNGDLLFLDIIARSCVDVDILGINAYRGISFTDMFERVKTTCGLPVLLTEFGSDAYHAVTGQEAQREQALYNVTNWKEVYQNAAGLGKAGNAIGGFTFQFSDGWWKYSQTQYLDVHDANASWQNGGYAFDFVLGQNNMNEEWYGICAKGPVNAQGFYSLTPRKAYYALKVVHQLNPYAPGTTLRTIHKHCKPVLAGLAE
jgi:hypothetical protein